MLRCTVSKTSNHIRMGSSFN